MAHMLSQNLPAVGLRTDTSESSSAMVSIAGIPGREPARPTTAIAIRSTAGIPGSNSTTSITINPTAGIAGSNSTTAIAIGSNPGTTGSNSSTATPINSNAGTTGSDSADFGCFLNLPQEIELMIWKIICQRARILNLSVNHNARDGATVHLKIVKKSRKVPAILHVSHTARVEALKYYTPVAFNTQYSNDQSSVAYYNEQFDIINLHQSNYIGTMVRRQVFKSLSHFLGPDVHIRRLAIEAPQTDLKDFKRMWNGRKGSLTTLEEVFLVVRSTVFPFDWATYQGPGPDDEIRAASSNGIKEASILAQKELVKYAHKVEPKRKPRKEPAPDALKKPLHHVISFAPGVSPNAVFDSLSFKGNPISFQHFNTDAYSKWRIQAIEQATTVKIVIAPFPGYRNLDMICEVGIVGFYRSNVERSKTLFLCFIEQFRVGELIKVDRTFGDKFAVKAKN